MPFVILRFTLALPAGFVRGQAVPDVEEQYYSCEKSESCLDQPVAESEFEPNDIQRCRTHRLPMKYPVKKKSIP